MLRCPAQRLLSSKSSHVSIRKNKSLTFPTSTLTTWWTNERDLSTSSLSSSSSSSFSTSVPSSVSRNNDGRPFDKVLIANRGEIACRVIRTCQTLGIPTVAIYSVADGPNALHARMADEAYLIGSGPHPTESYLLQDEILNIVDRSGAQAIHPGYGFLSENASFCTKVNDIPGVTFVGPPPNAITAMGSKSQSKAIMEAAGVPTTPGHYDDEQQDADFLYQQAEQIGYPLMIKAIMGGGGKGMRIVWNPNEFYEKLAACQREAYNGFGDERVLLEKYLHNPRHVEVQVVADQYGNAVHLHERDCSLQRRHQKIIEEAPASDLSIALRSQLGEMGKRAAKAVGYVNAGTVEFLLDTMTNRHDNMSSQEEGNQPFYFCEMNTRLQVEHPITEAITGIDLVEWQLRIAAGEELPIMNQDDIPCNGHAFEARIYAENPIKNFLPAAGTIWHHRPPVRPNRGMELSPTSSTTSSSTASTSTSKPGIRVDTGIQAGQDVGVYYDPMICKLIVHDENRTKALNVLIDQLKEYQIAGVPTNIDFLIHCSNHTTFQKAGLVHTGFLDDHLSDILLQMKSSSSSSSTSSPLATAVGVFATLLKLEQRVGTQQQQQPGKQSGQQSPWSSMSGSWRMGGYLPKRTILLDDGNDDNDGHRRKVECYSHRDGSFDIKVIDDDNSNGESNDDDDNSTMFHIDGTLSKNGDMNIVVNDAQRIQLTTVMKETSTTSATDGNNQIIQIRMWLKNNTTVGCDDNHDDYFWSINVQHPLNITGSTSQQQQHNNNDNNNDSEMVFIKAPMPGKVSKIHYDVGDTVQANDIVIVMEAMKMEHTIRTPITGTITEINVISSSSSASDNTNDDIIVQEDGIILMTIVPSTQNENDEEEPTVGTTTITVSESDNHHPQAV